MNCNLLNEWYCAATSWAIWHSALPTPNDDVLSDFHSMMDMGGEL